MEVRGRRRRPFSPSKGQVTSTLDPWTGVGVSVLHGREVGRDGEGRVTPPLDFINSP